MTESDIRALAERFFGAIEAGDVAGVEACYAPEAEIWHGHTRQSQDRATNVDTLRGFVARTRERRYTERDLRVLPDAFVQQHLLVATALGGARLELPAALVCDVEGGRIVRLREYFDPAPVTAWASRPDFA